MTALDRTIGVSVILASTCFEAMGQLAFKRAADHPPTAVAGPISTAWANRKWVLAGWLSFIIEGLLWSTALYFLDLTVAHPIGSLVFVVVALVARFKLGEKISPQRWAGIGLILGGSILVALN